MNIKSFSNLSIFAITLALAFGFRSINTARAATEVSDAACTKPPGQICFELVSEGPQADNSI